MYLFRADGNGKIGMGHLMRCLTIAEALADRLCGRGEISFCCADELSAEPVRAHGFAVQVFGTDYRSLQQELPMWERFQTKTNVILIDSYHVTDDYLTFLRKVGVTVLIDDMQKRCFPVDAVINYNAFAGEEIYRKLYHGKGTVCYIGSSYAPIRPQFTAPSYRVREQVQDVLITTGGGDADNIAGAILKELMAEEDSWGSGRRLHYHLVVGRYNPHLKELERAAAGVSRISLHRDVQDMAELMQKCDLAITAGGTTVYELSAVGVPFICFSYAENQEQLVHYIGDRKIAGYAGDYHRNAQRTLSAMRKLFGEYCMDAEKRNKCYCKEKELVDGCGAGRIAEKLTGVRKSRK